MQRNATWLVCLLTSRMLRQFTFKVVIEACEEINPQALSHCSGFTLIYCTNYTQTGVRLQVCWWPPQCSWQHIKRKEHTGLLEVCVCVYVCVRGFAPVVLYKYTAHIFSPAVAWEELASIAIKCLSHTHPYTYKFHPASRSYHKYRTHSHRAAIRWLWIRLLCPLRLYRMFDLFWLSEQAAVSRPRLLHYSKYQIPASAITTRIALSKDWCVRVCVACLIEGKFFSVLC